jgi:predicted XRE-type DNA-binding protein
MKGKKEDRTRFDHSGSSFDSFLEQEGILEEVEAGAIKRVLAWQLSKALKERHMTKQAMARELGTSRSQLDRLLDPENVSVSVGAMARAAKVLGKRLVIRITDAKPVASGRRNTLRTRKSICA